VIHGPRNKPPDFGSNLDRVKLGLEQGHVYGIVGRRSILCDTGFVGGGSVIPHDIMGLFYPAFV